ncbi:MAG: hypothetical protein M1834_002647 [Cirrosporium novae-zelandiae]|nr:MAG: hypothetical protein M1834_002647 [Cirrosporium novae-zelandiae]
MTDPTLSYISLNSSCRPAIVLLHGAFSSPNEYSLVTPHLPNYHLLIPSLPSHAASASIKPFTLTLTSRLLMNLIRTNAKDKKAHIVGVSLGAHIAIHLAANYPDVVSAVFASGYGRFKPSMWGPVLPYTVWSVHRFEAAVPNPVKRYFMDGADLDLGEESICTIQLCREVLAVIVSRDEIKPAKARTLVIAATKRGLVPSNDSVEDAKMVAEIMKKENGESKAVEMNTMRHPWDIQAPELFARCVAAWIEGTALPVEMVEL